MTVSVCLSVGLYGSNEFYMHYHSAIVALYVKIFVCLSVSLSQTSFICNNMLFFPLKKEGKYIKWISTVNARVLIQCAGGDIILGC